MTEPTPTTTTQDIGRYELLAAEYLDLGDKATAIAERRSQILAELRGLGAGKHQAGTYTVNVTPQRRFNPDKCAELLASNPELLATVQTTIVSSTLAKKVLPPAMYDMAMVEVGDPKVLVR